uniref:Uncharacterized protein n=1 Tax=Manihot esculenta TaxID=3983 RepID=A0A2C9UAG8_MANES
MFGLLALPGDKIRQSSSYPLSPGHLFSSLYDRQFGKTGNRQTFHRRNSNHTR